MLTPIRTRLTLKIITLLALVLASLSACDRQAPTIPPPTLRPTTAATLASTVVATIAPTVAPPASAAATPTAARPTAAPTRTPLPTTTPANTPPPTATPNLAPPSTPVGGATATITPSANSMKVKVFMIAPGDDGRSGKKIGCGDSVVAVERIIPATRAPLTAAYNELLALRDPLYGNSDLNNTLARSQLKIESIGIINAKATVRLSGTLSLAGVCDEPRVEAQLKETALQFVTVRDVAIFINGVPLAQAVHG